MIRRALIWLALLAMAVAVGIALGAGPLNSVEETTADPSTAPADIGPEVSFGNQLAATALTDSNGKGLAGTAVVVLTLPGASQESVEALTAAIKQARGTVSQVVGIGTQLTDPTQKMLAQSLGDKLAAQVSDQTTLTGYELIGRQIGQAVSTTSRAPRPANRTAAAMRDNLGTAGFLTGLKADAISAPRVAIVTGDAVDPAILTSLLFGLSSSSASELVAGPIEDPSIAQVRAGTDRPATQSTFDGLGSATDLDVDDQAAAGAAAAVAILIGQRFDSHGDYGASGVDGPVRVG